MAKIGYDNTLNRGGGPSPLKGVFSAVGSVFKKKSKTKAKDAPKKNKGEGIGAYSKRLAESQSSGDSALAYTPLYNTDPDKKKKKKDRTIHLDNVNVDGDKLTGSMNMKSQPLGQEGQEKPLTNQEKRTKKQEERIKKKKAKVIRREEEKANKATEKKKRQQNRKNFRNWKQAIKGK